mgnify:FL=1
MSKTFTIFKEITCTEASTLYTELVYTAPVGSAVIVDIRIWAEATNTSPVGVSLWTNKEGSLDEYMPGMECYRYPLTASDALRIDRFVLEGGDRVYVSAFIDSEQSAAPKITIQVRGVL